MRGVSEVIAIILILMITIAIAGLAYTFMSSTMASTTSAASSAVDSTTSSMLTSFMIESMDAAKVYIRNTGQNAISSLSVYVNDEPATYDITQSNIAVGQVGTITIYSFIPDGATVKITSPSGFSTSKVANPCSKAVGCWKFDEGIGTIAYDSSPYGNSGTLINSPTWTGSKYGGAIQFDGSYVFIPNSNSLSAFPNGLSISLLLKSSNFTGARSPLSRWGSNNGYGLYNPSSTSEWYMGNSTWVHIYSGFKFDDLWHLCVLVWNGTHMKSYYDSSLNSTTFLSNPTFESPSNNGLFIGGDNRGGGYFNGTIDEVRVYNRAIY